MIPNIATVKSENNTETQVNQLQLMFLVLNRLNFKGNFLSTNNPTYFIARARDVIIEQGEGFGNEVSTTLRNFEANLYVDIKYVGRHTIPSHHDTAAHFKVKVYSEFSNTTSEGTLSTPDEVLSYIQEAIDEVLPTFLGGLVNPVQGMTVGKEYIYKKIIACGLPVGYIQTEDDAGNELIIESDSIV